MGIRSVPAAVLKNKGVPVTLFELVRNPDGTPARPHARLETQAGEPVEVEVFVRLTNLALADIEERWGGLSQWEQSLKARPFGTIIDTLAIALEEDRRAIGLRMVDGRLEDYSTAVGAAFMLANGVEPDKVGEVVARGVRAAAEARQKMMADSLDKLLPAEQPTATPGPTGSEPGSAPAELLTSSGV